MGENAQAQGGRGLGGNIRSRNTISLGRGNVNGKILGSGSGLLFKTSGGNRASTLVIHDNDAIGGELAFRQLERRRN